MKKSVIKRLVVPLLLLSLVFSLPFAAVTASAETLDTNLTLTGPTGDLYEGDTAVFTATLTDSNGDGVQGKTVKLTPSLGDPLYEQTNAEGVAEFKINDLEAKTYKVYAEFVGNASDWGGNIYNASESGSVYLAVKPASEKPTEPVTDPAQSSDKIPTSVTISVEREGTESRWFDIKVAAVDENGAPVLEDVGDNIELYVNGAKAQSAKLYSDDGKRTLEYRIPDNGEYDIYVKYIGLGSYASSESGHIILNVLDDSYTAVPVDPQPAEPTEPEQPTEEPETGDDPAEEQPTDEKAETAVSISIERETETSDYVTIKVTVTDAEGNAVTAESAGKDIELYINGVKTQDTSLNDWSGDYAKYNSGTTTLTTNFKLDENTPYDIYVVYTGSDAYASAESLHYTVTLTPDSFTAEPVVTEEPEPSEEPEEGGDDQQTVEEPGTDTGDDETTPAAVYTIVFRFIIRIAHWHFAWFWYLFY